MISAHKRKLDQNFLSLRSSPQQQAGMESGGGGKAASRVSEKVCRCCKERYEPSANTPGSCRFHPSFFVCRRHDDQKR
jgi:hypothetical protein